MQLEQKVAKQLIKHNRTLAVAESCTGGYLTHRLTNISGSSAFLIATIISYANRSKTKFLKVPADLINKKGAVSADVAKLMAQNVRSLFKTDFGIAITGIAGPTGGTIIKPVGTVFISVCEGKKQICEHHVFKGSRLSIKKQAADRSLEILFNLLTS